VTKVSTETYVEWLGVLESTANILAAFYADDPLVAKHSRQGLTYNIDKRVNQGSTLAMLFHKCLLIGLLVGGCSRPIEKLQAAQSCPLISNSKIFLQKGESNKAGSTLLQMWELDDSSVFWMETKPDSKSFIDFRAVIEKIFSPVDSVSLLQKIADDTRRRSD
jgi:hypothetical protein